MYIGIYTYTHTYFKWECFISFTLINIIMFVGNNWNNWRLIKGTQGVDLGTSVIH